MVKIPVTIVDNFFEDPSLWRDLALSCVFSPDPQSRYPGIRTKALHEIDRVAYDTFTKKFFSLYYNIEEERIDWQLNAYFQKMPKNMDGGWIHYDREIVAGIVYLTPNANINSGTSFYKPNKICNIINVDKKHAEVSGKLKTEFASKYKKENEEQFTETIRVNNVYNRLVAFDCNIAHTANINKDDDERLTLVFFVNRLNVQFTPIERMNRNSL